MSNRLIYVLNNYSKKSDEHYFHVINFLDKLADTGVEIALIIEKSDELPVFRNPNIKIYPLSKGSKYLRGFKFLKALNKLYSEGYRKIFIRISQNAIIPAIFYSFFSKLETYYWHSGTVLEYDRKHKPKLRLFIDEVKFWFIKTYTTWFVTGPESMKQYYIKHNVKADKIIILYNDIDISRFFISSDKEKNKEKLCIPKEEKVILFVHRLSPVRETLFYMPYIIEEFYKNNNIEDYKFYIIGGGSDKDKLEKEIEQKKLSEKVKILGSKPNAVIQDFYSVADIFINPTMAEGFPRVIIEAMAVGLPVVTTDAGGIKDIMPAIQQEYIVDKKDREAFAAKMVELAQLKNKTDLGRENRNHVIRFSTENVASMYKNTIFNHE